MSNLLSIENLEVVFHAPAGDSRALRGVNFDIERGKIFGIVGESGCGKSVTGKAIMGLVPHPGEVTGGKIIFKGEDLLAKSKRDIQKLRGSEIGMIFQDPGTSLNPVFTVEQQMVSIMQHHSNDSRKAMRDKAAGLLDDVGLPNPQNILKRYPHELSGGMQQRVMIAIALSMEADLLIADEPTTALDVTIQAQILDLLLKLRDEKGVTIMLITHDMGVVAETCDDMAVLYAGRVVEQGSVHDVFKNPHHPYTQGLLAALPDPASRGRLLKVIPGAVPSGMTDITGCAFADRCDQVLPHCAKTPLKVTQFTDSHRTWCHLFDHS